MYIALQLSNVIIIKDMENHVATSAEGQYITSVLLIFFFSKFTQLFKNILLSSESSIAMKLNELQSCEGNIRRPYFDLTFSQNNTSQLLYILFELNSILIKKLKA